MMTLLGSLIGFGASAFPEILKLKREKEDRKQQLALLDRQIEQQKLGHVQKLEELNVTADIKEMDQVYGYANRDSGVGYIEWVAIESQNLSWRFAFEVHTDQFGDMVC